MTHHPHIHMIVPGGGISLDAQRWISSRPAFLLPVRLGALFRRLFLTQLIELYQAGDLPSSAPRQVSPTAACSCVASPQSGRSGSWSMPSRRSPAPRPCSLSPRYTHRVAVEPTSDCVRRDRRHLPLQGLPSRRCRTAARHDARAARVHPPLPAPRPATRLSPHPALRLARQFSTQSKYCACPRAAWRRAPARACRIARAARSSPALSLLRRAHVHHRDLRALEATPRATSRICTNRERPLVTRHALRSSHAATPPLRRMRPYALFAKLSATGPNMSRGQLPIHAPPDEKSHQQVPADASAQPVSPSPQQSKTSNPHRPPPQPRGFVHGRFPYAGPCPDARPVMAGIRKPVSKQSYCILCDSGDRREARRPSSRSWVIRGFCDKMIILDVLPNSRVAKDRLDRRLTRQMCNLLPRIASRGCPI